MSATFNRDVLEKFFVDEVPQLIYCPLTSGTGSSSLNTLFVHMIKLWSLLTIHSGDDWERFPSNTDVSRYLESLLFDRAKGRCTVSSLLEVYAILLAVVAGKLSGPVLRSDVAELDFTCYSLVSGDSVVPIGRLNLLLAEYVKRQKIEPDTPFTYVSDSIYPQVVQKFRYLEHNMDLSELKTLLKSNANPPAGDPPRGDPPASDPPAGDPPAGDPPASDPPASDPPASDPPASDPPAGATPLKIDVKIFRDADENLSIIDKVNKKLKHQEPNKRADRVVILNSMENCYRLHDLFRGDNNVIVVDDPFRWWRSMVDSGLID
jgi:hypothetical protein